MTNDFPSKILTATDASEDALLATRAAIDLSSRTGAELHLVHAWQDVRPPAFPAMAIDEYSQAYERWKRGTGELLDEQAKRLRSAGGTVAGAHLREGRPPRRGDHQTRRGTERGLGDNRQPEARGNETLGHGKRL